MNTKNTTNESKKMEALRTAARLADTETIADAIKEIGGGHVDTETRMTRAALIDVYGERLGDNAADAIMDEIGL